MLSNRRNENAIRPSRFRADLIYRLGIAAERHGPTVASVLGMTTRGADLALSRHRVRARWHKTRAAERKAGRRATWLRYWWRKRLTLIGIDPITIRPDDPMWAACWRRPRGALVRDVRDEMRAELLAAGVPDSKTLLATDERIEELLERVAARLKADALGLDAVRAGLGRSAI